MGERGILQSPDVSPGHSLGSAMRWSYVMDGGRQAITSVITLVLAALLGPEAFGVIAMALVYLALLELVLKQGMGAAVVQREDLRGAHLDTAFWIVMGTALALTGVSAGLSGWWAGVNRTPELQPVILGLTAMIPLQGLTVVQEALLRRRFRFRSLALRTNVSVLCGGALGVGLALAGFGVWALVAQQVGTVLVATAVLWAVSGWRPGMRVSAGAARELLGFSTGSFLGSLGVFLINRSDALLIGLFFGPVVVGLYRLASRLIEAVVGITVSALMSVSLPELSRAQHDPVRFKRGVLRLTWISAALTLPPLGLLAGASEGVLGVVGQEWLPAAWALRLLCVAGAVRALFAFTGPMLQALGRPYEQAAVAWVTGLLSSGGFVVAGLLVRGMPLGSQLGGLALSQALLYGLVFAAICMVLVRHRAGVTLAEMSRAAAPALGAGLAATATGVVAWRTLGLAQLSPWPALLLAAAPAAVAGLALLGAADARFRAVVRQAYATVHALRARQPETSGEERPHAVSMGGGQREAALQAGTRVRAEGDGKS